MSLYRLNIYDQNAQPRTDIPDSELDKLDKRVQLPRFLEVMKTWPDSVDADAALIVAEKEKRAAIADLARRQALHQQIVPARTFYDEWKRTVAKQPEPEQDQEITRRLEKSAKGIEAARLRVEQAEPEITVAKHRRNEKRLAFGAALRAWAEVDGSPKSVGDLVKERAMTETKQKLANIANGLPPDYAEQLQSSVGPSHLDRVKANGGAGHRGDCNYGHNRNAMRGAQLQRQLPSER
jgi:hypothetical protein